jgi:outer membrane receptor protein involved in Fe transport
MKFRINAIAAGMALVPALAISGTAGAQMLEEVIVTAQKRSESLSDVPISVNVVGGEMISSQGITNLNDLSDYVPNLSMNQTGLGTNVTIRGISSGINPAFEQSVGMYVDDVFYGRPQLARVPYLDINRVEVLRGPQPILFGKNAIAGAISATTNKASTDEMEGFIETDYNFDQDGYGIQGAVNIPITDTFAIRLAGLKRESDGYYDNTFLGEDEEQLDQQVLRANFQWDATDDLSVNLKIENSDFETDGRSLEIINPVGSPSYASALLTATGGAVVLDDQQDFKRQSNGDHDETDVDNITLTLDYALGEHTLTSVTSSMKYDYFQQCDCDFTSAAIIQTAGNERYEQFSQELRLASPGGETIDYIVGAYYSDYDIDNDELLAIDDNSILAIAVPAAGPAIGFGNTRLYTSESEQWSVFGQFTWNINDELRVTLGGRYSEEDKEGTRKLDIIDLGGDTGPHDRTIYPATTEALPPIIFSAGFGIDSEQFGGHNLAGKRTESKFTPAVNMQWDATDETMLYASYTEGFKAGGFDARSNSNQNFEFEEELATSYELGAKMSLADGAAELNVALYYTEYDDLQTSQFDGTLGFNVTNASTATVQGIELDGRWQLTEDFYLSGAVGVLDFEFDDFANSQCFFGETPTNATTGLCSRKGDTREFAPELTANIGAAYDVAVTDDMGITFGVDLSYSDEYFASPTLDPNLEQDSFVKVNARVELASSENVWSVALLGENLTDEEIKTFGNQAPLSTTLTGGSATAYYSFYEAPRNVALKVRYNF